MKRHNFIRNKQLATTIWNNRKFYRLENFMTSDICKIYINLNPDSQILSRRNHYRSFVQHFKNIAINDITTSSLREWFNSIKEKSDLSERTLLQVKCQITPLFKWLTNEGILQVNPLETVKFRRNVPPKRQRCLLNEAELWNIIADSKEWDSVVLYPYIYSIILTGARRAEIAKLLWDDVDLESGYILLRNTKNGSDRKIKISGSLVRLLSKKERSSDHVFPNKRGKFLNRSAIERMIKRFKADRQFTKDWQIHDLRHSYALNFLKKGGEMYQLQALLGHRSIQMTVDLYGNLKSYDVKDPSPYNF